MMSEGKDLYNVEEEVVDVYDAADVRARIESHLDETMSFIERSSILTPELLAELEELSKSADGILSMLDHKTVTEGENQ